MTSFEPTTPNPPRLIWPWLLFALSVVLAAGAFAAWYFLRPLHVTVDDVPRTVEARSTVQSLQREGFLDARPGALLSVKGEIIRPHGGDPATITRNGTPVSLDRRLVDGDVIASNDGADKTEASTTRREYTPIAVVRQGVGPIVSYQRLGAPGIAEIVRGSVSGVEASRTVIDAGDTMIVTRRAAARGDKLVALTFDDGPSPGSTEKILKILKHEDVHATFFMIGRAVRKYPRLASKVATEGHLVGSHSFTHPELTKLKAPAIRKEIGSAIDAITGATGVRPVWFRPPYGAVNGTVRAQARGLNAKIAMWDIDSLDWTKPGVHKLYRNAVRSTTTGDVVLMHDGGGDRKQTAEALPIIIRDLRSKGFSFVTLDELAAAK